MKRKYIAITLGIVLTLSSLINGCGAAEKDSASASSAQSTVSAAEKAPNESEASNTEETAADSSEAETASLKTQADYAGQSIQGTVTEVADQQIIIQLDADAQAEKSESDASGQSGEIVSVEVSDDTAVTRERADASDGGAPAKPDGESSDSGAPQGEPPAKPDGESSDSGAPQGEPPAKPDEESSDSGAPQGETPAKPDGESSDSGAPQGEPPAKPDGENGDSQTPDNNQSSENPELTVSDISVGDSVEVTVDDDGKVTAIVVKGGMQGNAPGGAPGSQAADISYSAVKTFSEDTEVTGEIINSAGSDEEAVLVSEGASVKLNDMTITRDSDDSTGGDNASFYGVGAAVLTTEGTAAVKDSTITTDAKGGAGVFSYGENSTVYVSDTTIKTEQDTSGGIHAAGGGTLYAYNLDVTTNGESSAAIRSDRGGGTMTVDGGSYISNGKGSPAIYSTADIAVNQADLTATGSEAICIEGKNAIHLFDSDLTGNMPENEQNDCTWNVILYQSMSGDSVEGNSTFEMQGGTLTAENGGMFYTTNTESTFILNHVDIQYADENDFFLKCTGNSNARGWGSSGENGADCSFTAIDQNMEGNILWDSISELDFYMTGASTLTGAFLQDESNAGDGGSGYASLNIDEEAVWVVTEDSTLTNLNCAGTIKDSAGKSVTVKGTDGTVYVQGDSSITVTVRNYSEEANLDGMSETTEWADYSAELPE